MFVCWEIIFKQILFFKIFVVTSQFTPSSVLGCGGLSCLQNGWFMADQETLAGWLCLPPITDINISWNRFPVLHSSGVASLVNRQNLDVFLGLNQFADHYRLGRVSMPENLAANDSFWHKIINCIDYSKLLLVQPVTLIVILNWRYFIVWRSIVILCKIRHETPGDHIDYLIGAGWNCLQLIL